MSYLTNPYMVTPAQVCQTTQSWDESGTTSQSALYAGNKREYQGVIFLSGSDFLLQNLKTATFNIEKTLAPTGTLYCRLYSAVVIGSGLASIIEQSSTEIDIDGDLSTGEQLVEFTFTGDNDIAQDNGLIIYGSFSSSDSSNYVNCMGKTGIAGTTEPVRQYQKEAGSAPTDTVWEGQSNMNVTLKVCN